MHELHVHEQALRDLCRRWKIAELSVFGSALRGDFDPDSDVDLLVVFEPKAGWDAFELVALRDEFAALFGRAVDMVEPASLLNPFRRQEILRHCEVLYAA